MNILFINATFGIGSTGKIVSNLCSFLEKEGHRCFVACQKSCKESDNIIKIGNTFDWKMHALKSRLFGDQAFHSTLATKKIKRIIKSKKIDVVNVHNIHSNFINYHELLKILNKAGVPVALTLHDCWFFTGKCFHYIDANCDKFKTQCDCCPKFKGSPVSLFFDRSKQLQQRKKKDYENFKKLYVVACSDWIASEAKQSILSCARDIVTIQNGIDTEIFNLNQRNNYIKGNKIKVLGMANKFRLKQNSEIINKLFNDPSFDLTICGCSNDDIKYFLSLSKRVNLLPVQRDQKSLQKIYSNADVFLNLTFADTFPTVNLESICCGTPVVAYKRGGAAEVITDISGRVVKDSGYESLKKSLIEASKLDKQVCSDYGLDKFNEKKSYLKYIKYFQMIVEANR